MAKRLAILLFTTAISTVTLAQQQNAKIDLLTERLQPKLDSLTAKDRFQKADSLQTRWQNKIDSLKSLGNLNRYRDSLKVVGWADSLRASVTSSIGKKQNDIYQKVDSLLVRNQPTNALRQKADSLQRKQQALMGEISAKQNQLQQKLTARYQKWTGKLDSLRNKPNLNNTPLNGKISGAPNLNNAANQLKLPNAQLPGINLNNPSIPNTSLPVSSTPSVSVPGQVPSLGTQDFAGLNLSKDLQNAGGKFSLPNIDQLKQWDSQLKNVASPLNGANGKLSEMNGALKDPGKAAEDAAKQLNDVSTVGKELGDADKLLKENEAMKTAEKMKDPNALKEEAAKKAIDHFAGKEEQLKQAMDQMAKYKKKLPSLESLDKLPKHLWIPRNGLKGKPFRERVRFGGNVGFQNKRDTLWLDFFPNVSYNLTGRVELGAGFNYRLKWNVKKSAFDQSNPTWGFNMFGTFKTYTSVRMRLEADAFSTPKFGGVGEPMQRQWRWTWLLGVQTAFNVSKNCTGNVQMLYNFDRAITAGFPEQLVLRVGLQWKLNPHAKTP